MSSYKEAGSDIQMPDPEPPVSLRRRPLEGIDPNVPDQRLTASVSKVMKRAAYSPIPPFTTPTSKVSGGVTLLDPHRGPGELTTTTVGVREPRDITGSSIEDMFCSEGFQPTSQDLDSDSPDNAPLNTLGFKPAFQMVDDFKQSYKMEHEGKVQHLQGYITDLELSLKALGRECQSSRSNSPAPPSDSSTNLPPESSMNLPPESSIYPSPVKMVSRGTVTRFFPKLSDLGMGSVSSPTEECFSFRSALSGGDVTKSTTDTFTTSVMETQRVRIDTCERWSETVNPQTNIAASQTNPVVTCTTEVQTEMVEANTDTTRVQTEKVKISSHTTPTQTEIINTTITASQTIPLITCTTEAETDMVETSTNTTEVQTEKEISSHTTYTQNKEVENIHTATAVSLSDPLITCTAEVQTEDVELATCTTDAQTEGVTTSDALTMVTPLKHLSQDICVGTSPFLVSLPRPSEVGSSEFSVQQLCCSLESASVSNSLLRSEVESLQSQSASQNHLVSRLQGELSQAETKVKLLNDYRANFNLQDDVGVSLLSHLFTGPSGDGGEKLERLRWLLSHVADVNQPDCHMITPVVLACQQGELLCVQELVEAGADVGIEGYTWRAIFGGDKGRKIIKSTLSSAIYSDSLELVKYILDKAPTSCVDKWKKDASHLQKAIGGYKISGEHTQGNLDIVRLLVSHDWDWTSNLEDLVDLWLDDGATFTRTLLHSAALSSVKMLQYWISLYESRGLDINTSELFTPLHEASNALARESMQLLLNHGADPGRRDMVGALPVDYVWKLCGIELLDFLSRVHDWDHCMSLNCSLVLYRHAYPDYLLGDDVCRQMLGSGEVFCYNLPVSETQGWKYCNIILIYSSILYAVIPNRNSLRTALRKNQIVTIKGQVHEYNQIVTIKGQVHEYNLSQCERWLHLMAVTSLKQLARDAARRCMHRHIESKIRTLSCPNLIKDFLNLGDVVCLIQEYRDACDRFTPCPRVR